MASLGLRAKMALVGAKLNQNTPVILSLPNTVCRFSSDSLLALAQFELFELMHVYFRH